MSATHFWNGKKVISYDQQFFIGNADLLKRQGMFCVDEFCKNPTQRYGKFRKDAGWEPVSLDDFPKEFRAHLLLLGVS